MQTDGAACTQPSPISNSPVPGLSLNTYMRHKLSLMHRSVHCLRYARRRILTEAEVAILVADALAEVDVASLTVAVGIPQGSTENGDVTVTFKGEVNVIC